MVTSTFWSLGCGTGQHSIETARRFKGAQVLAIDLSLASLCYAKRQTRALGQNNIHYAQADIMMLSSITQTFDVIETSGVLHHLADPLAGWRVLLSMLRPGALCCSACIARPHGEISLQREISLRRAVIARPRTTSADSERRYSHCADGTPLKNVTLVPDFFSVSAMPGPSVPRPGTSPDLAQDRGIPCREQFAISRLRGRFANQAGITLGIFRPTLP